MIYLIDTNELITFVKLNKKQRNKILDENIIKLIKKVKYEFLVKGVEKDIDMLTIKSYSYKKNLISLRSFSNKYTNLFSLYGGKSQADIYLLTECYMLNKEHPPSQTLFVDKGEWNCYVITKDRNLLKALQKEALPAVSLDDLISNKRTV